MTSGNRLSFSLLLLHSISVPSLHFLPQGTKKKKLKNVRRRKRQTKGCSKWRYHLLNNNSCRFWFIQLLLFFPRYFLFSFPSFFSSSHSKLHCISKTNTGRHLSRIYFNVSLPSFPSTLTSEDKLYDEIGQVLHAVHIICNCPIYSICLIKVGIIQDFLWMGINSIQALDRGNHFNPSSPQPDLLSGFRDRWASCLANKGSSFISSLPSLH